MKKLFTTIALTCWALSAAIPALGGADFDAIDRARKANVAKQADQARRVQGLAPTTVACPPDELVLPLDHGPRAQTTPSENRLRMKRHAAELAACTEAEAPYKATK